MKAFSVSGTRSEFQTQDSEQEAGLPTTRPDIGSRKGFKTRVLPSAHL